MKTIVLVIAAAGTLLAGGAAVAKPLQLAQWSLSTGPRGESDPGTRDRDVSAQARGDLASGCKPITVRERRGGEIIERQIHRC
jgi:hypothetical protein